MQKAWVIAAVVGMMALSSVAMACDPGAAKTCTAGQLKAWYRPHTAGVYNKVVVDNETGQGEWAIRLRAYNPTKKTVQFHTMILGCFLSDEIGPGAVKTKLCTMSGNAETGSATVMQASREGDGIVYSGRICYDPKATPRSIVEDADLLLEEKE